MENAKIGDEIQLLTCGPEILCFVNGLLQPKDEGNVKCTNEIIGLKWNKKTNQWEGKILNEKM